jgi:hypothetical protein
VLHRFGISNTPAACPHRSLPRGLGSGSAVGPALVPDPARLAKVRIVPCVQGSSVGFLSHRPAELTGAVRAVCLAGRLT